MAKKKTETKAAEVENKKEDATETEKQETVNEQTGTQPAEQVEQSDVTEEQEQETKENVPKVQATDKGFVARMKEELAELSERTKKLGNFIHDNAEYKKLKHEKQALMQAQYKAMVAYEYALRQRVAAEA